MEKIIPRSFRIEGVHPGSLEVHGIDQKHHGQRIDVLDHLIVTQDRYVSLKERGLGFN